MISGQLFTPYALALADTLSAIGESESDFSCSSFGKGGWYLAAEIR